MKVWIVRILGGLVGLVVISLSTVFVLSERAINKRHAFKEYPISVPTDSATLAQGERLVKMRCAGCHGGDSLPGNPAFFDEPMIARVAAPNVPARIASLTDAELAAFMRSGIRKNGTSPFIMPPPGLYHISDADLGALIAYLRKLPVSSTTTPPNAYRLLGRVGVMTGQFKTAVAAFDTTQERVGQDTAWATTRNGEYLTRIICTECHGVQLTGAAGPPAATPSIAMAAGYSADEFRTLLRTGTPRVSSTQLTLMAEVARASLTLLTDAEISAIYEYLKALPASGVR